jgi:peptidoglycan/LPS O-acetylase OafA/YrhL
MKIEIRQLTFTRFLAAICIVFLHYTSGIFPFNVPAIKNFISHANLGVCYFFVLSGFILSMVYGGDYFSKPNALKKFFMARFARIYPVYLIALLLGMLSVWLYQHEKFSVTSAISNALLVQAWIPLHLKTYNLPGWSLSVEAFFYLVFPWLMYKVFKGSFRNSLIIAFAVWALSFIIYFVLPNPDSNSAGENMYLNVVTNPLLQLNNFLLGMAGGYAYHQNKLGFIKKHATALLAGTIILMMLIFFIPNPIVENSRDGLLAPLFLLFILSITFHQGAMTRLFSHRFLVYLGEISYGIYILQAPLGMWYKGFIFKAGINMNGTLFTYSFIVFLLLSSAITYSFIEKPLREYLRSRKSKEQNVYPSVVK